MHTAGTLEAKNDSGYIDWGMGAVGVDDLVFDCGRDKTYFALEYSYTGCVVHTACF